MLEEAMSIGLQHACEIFEPSAGDAVEEGPSKAERGRAQGAVLGAIRTALAET